MAESSPSDVVILAGARSAFGKLNGVLSSQTAVQLGSHAIGAAIERAGISPAEVDAVIMGQVVQAGAGQGPARQAAIGAGVGWDVPAVTVNKICLSGLTAIIDATRLVKSGEATVVVAGGQESMSNGPHLLPGSRKGWPYGNVTVVDSVAHDGLTDAFDKISMGASTETAIIPLGIGRDEQDMIAAASHRRAADAASAGLLTAEIAPLEIPQRRGPAVVVDTDEGIRPDTTAESLGKLRAAFDPEGTITAGNASPLSDGAAAVVLTTRAYAEQHDLPFLAVVGACGQVAGPDNSLHSQPARAIEQAIKRDGLSASDLDFVEINEAFAAVAVQSMRDLGYPLDKTNIHGGAIALGHPIGASGARLALHAAMELDRRGSGRAAVALCGGGGQGEALLLYRD
jgi:acetyl-CoA C-acetyltransferase